jgi:hypothetical protein
MIRAKGISSPVYGQGHLPLFFRGPICRKFARFRTSAYHGVDVGPSAPGGSSTRDSGSDSITIRNPSTNTCAGFTRTCAGFTRTCTGLPRAGTLSACIFVGAPSRTKLPDVPRAVATPATQSDVSCRAATSTAQLRVEFRCKCARTSNAAVER